MLSLAGSFPVLLGMIALVIIVAVAVLSLRYARRRLQYETWHAIHLALYVAVALALIHQMFEVSTFTATTLSTVYWWSLWVFAAVALLAGMTDAVLRSLRALRVPRRQVHAERFSLAG